MHKETSIWSLYRITNNINGKVYIGQAADLSKRWSDHYRAARLNKPTQVVHYALIKYGLDNFVFEVVATCKSQDNANWLETELISQYDSFISNGKGYNVTLGGMNAPKTEAFKQMMRDWHASLSPEEKQRRAEIHRQNLFNLFATKGHPALGTKRTEKQLQNLSRARLENPVEYTPEIRQRMSEAHLGHKLTKEAIEKQSASLTEWWEKRNAIREATDELKCGVLDCTISGSKQPYKIIDGVRYCNKHGLRMWRNGTTEKLSTFKYTSDNPMPEDVRKRCGQANIGKVAHNRIQFTSEQISTILADPRSARKMAKDFGVTEKVIRRVRDGKY